MKVSQLIIFISIVFTVYASANIYIFVRGMYSIPSGTGLRPYYTVLFLFLGLSYILSRILERSVPGTFTDSLALIGSMWFSAMLLFLTFLLLIDFLRILNFIIPWYPGFLSRNPVQTRLVTSFTLTMVVLIMVVGGYINALNPRIKVLDIDIHKKAGNRNSLNLVAITDIHFGTVIGKKKAIDLVKRVNALKPDIIILGGDMIDESISSVIRNGSADEFKNLKAPLGVYAIIGNHELFGGVDRAIEYLSHKNMQFLLDDTIKIDNSFYLIGRLDKDITRFSGRERKPLKDIISGMDKNLPLILLDHQPFKLNEAAENNIDLQISGHTHYGQQFPANLITKAIYELAYGYKKTGNTHYYVSSGFGTWGPPVRIFTKSEIVQFRISFEAD